MGKVISSSLAPNTKYNAAFKKDKWPKKHLIANFSEKVITVSEEADKHQIEKGKLSGTEYTKEALIGGKNLLEVCFMCDCTASMGSYINSAKNTVYQMIGDLKEMNPAAVIKIGFVGYLDHCDPWITKTLNFTTVQQNINTFIDGLSPQGGGDFPEAVVDALFAARKMNWSEDSAKILIHILDAPPHGKEFLTGSDNHPNGIYIYIYIYIIY